MDMHIAGKTRTDQCPTANGDTCPTCGGRLELEYGFGDGYGLGSFMRCQNCLNVYNFMPDNG